MDYIRLEIPVRKGSRILALGAQSKSSFCFIEKGIAYLSKSDGDLSNLENFKVFVRKIDRFRQRLKLRPEIIACDLHPGYISTTYAHELAKNKGVKIKLVQHHQAHIASCMVDNAVSADVIGIAFDGTGFGLDRNIWGGEFFIGNFRGFKRAAHLRYVPMPGGEAAIKEPARMALSYLYASFLPGVDIRTFGLLTGLDKDKIKFLIEVINRKINSPLTSSVGRLFDAVSSILGICRVAKYEAQPAIELEKIIRSQGPGIICKGRYKFRFLDEKPDIIIDWAPLIKGIVRDLSDRKGIAEISLRFHNSLCYMIKDVCCLLRDKYKIQRVCMSGGVFQNKYLSNNLRRILEKNEFEVYLHKKIPSHDGNIALGQAVMVG